VTIVRADGGETAGLIDLKDGSIRDLGIHGHGFVYVAAEWLACQQGTTILAITFDPELRDVRAELGVSARDADTGRGARYRSDASFRRRPAEDVMNRRPTGAVTRPRPW
jgi:hypothetical protein